MEFLLTAIVTWLSVNWDLPEIYELPRVAFASQQKMRDVQASRPGPDRSPGPEVIDMPRKHSGHGIVALYDDSSRTIYLPQGWEGNTAAELSVLVHEMVHHLQNVAGLRYECAQAREEPAYHAQEKWLALFGRKLTDEFELDAMTMLLRTKCMH